MTDAIQMAIEYIESVPDDRLNAEHIDREWLIAALRAQPADNDEYVQGYKNGVKREAEIWRERLDAERQRSVHIEAMNRKLLEHVANMESLTKPSPMILITAQPAIGLQTAIRLVLEATPEQLPMAIDALRDFVQPDHIPDAGKMVDHRELVNDAARYAHVLECDYLATKTYLPETTREERYAKLREKHDAGRAAIGEAMA